MIAEYKIGAATHPPTHHRCFSLLDQMQAAQTLKVANGKRTREFTAGSTPARSKHRGGKLSWET